MEHSFPEHEEFVRRFSLRDEDGVELSDAVGIIFVELTKLTEVMKRPIENLTGEELWALFLAIGSDPTQRELFNKMIAARREIGMAVELLQTISRDENERARFRARRKFQMDMEHGLIVAGDERAIAIAKKLLKRNRPIDEIIEDTGLTRAEVEGLHVAN